MDDELQKLMDNIRKGNDKITEFDAQLDQHRPLDTDNPRDMLLIFLSGQVRSMYRVLVLMQQRDRKDPPTSGGDPR